MKLKDLEKFFENLGRGAAKATKVLAGKVANNPTGALDLAADLSTAAATRNPKAKAENALSVLMFIHQLIGSFWEKHNKNMIDLEFILYSCL